MPPKHVRVCIIEDNVDMSDLIEEVAQEAWPDSKVFCTKCLTVRDALVELVKVQFDVITLDLLLPSVSGLIALSIVHGYAPITPILLCSGMKVDIPHLESYGVVRVFQKPFQVQEFLIALIEAVGGVSVVPEHALETLELVSSGVLSYRLLYNIFLESADAMIVSDGDIILGVNKQVPLLFGYHVSELLSKPVEMLVPEHLREQHTKERLAYNRQPRFRMMGPTLDLYGQHKDGSLFPVEVNLSPFMELAGLRVVATIRRRIRQARETDTLSL